MIAAGDFVEIVNVPARDLGQESAVQPPVLTRSAAQAATVENCSATATVAFRAGKLDKPNIGEMWVRLSQVRPCANGAGGQMTISAVERCCSITALGHATEQTSSAAWP